MLSETYARRALLVPIMKLHSSLEYLEIWDRGEDEHEDGGEEEE